MQNVKLMNLPFRRLVIDQLSKTYPLVVRHNEQGEAIGPWYFRRCPVDSPNVYPRIGRVGIAWGHIEGIISEMVYEGFIGPVRPDIVELRFVPHVLREPGFCGSRF